MDAQSHALPSRRQDSSTLSYAARTKNELHPCTGLELTTDKTAQLRSQGGDCVSTKRSDLFSSGGLSISQKEVEVVHAVSKSPRRQHGCKGPLWRRSDLNGSIGSSSSSSGNYRSVAGSASCENDIESQAAAKNSSIFGIEQYVNLCSSEATSSSSSNHKRVPENNEDEPPYAISNASVFPVASHTWDHVNEMDGVGELQTLASPAPAQRAHTFSGETETSALHTQTLPKGEHDIRNNDEDNSDGDDEDFVDTARSGLGGPGPATVHEEGSCSRCQSQQHRVIAAQNDSGAMVPLLDLDAPFRFPATHITKRPKLSSMRLLAYFDVHLGELVVSSYSEDFGIDFEYSMDGKPYEDLRGKSIRALEGKATNVRGKVMEGFEMAARQNSRASGVVNVYTSRGNAKQCYMEWIPLCPNRSSLDDTLIDLPARQYLIRLSHMLIRGYTDSEDKYRLRFIGEHVLPLPTASRRRADTSKTSRRCTRRQTQQNRSSNNNSATLGSLSIPSGSIPWGLQSGNERHPGNGESISYYENIELNEVRDVVRTADFASTLLEFMSNQGSNNVPLPWPSQTSSQQEHSNRGDREMEEEAVQI